MDRRFAAGALTGLGSAILFGLSAPLAKLLLPRASPWLLAGLLYLGAGFGLSLILHRRGVYRGNDRLQRQDIPRLLVIVGAGGVAGPLLLLIGLTHVSGITGSLLLNLEAVFTVGLAVLVFGERLNRTEWVGALLVLAGAIVLTYRPQSWQSDMPGAMAIAGACLSWALDNNLTRQISHRNPIQIVQIKTLSAGVGNVALAALVGQRAPVTIVPAALVLGFFSYGLSIVLDVYALRFIGAAREAAFFATAPFVGAIAAIPLLNERLVVNDIAAGLLMAVGLLLMLRRALLSRSSAESSE